MASEHPEEQANETAAKPDELKIFEAICRAFIPLKDLKPEDQKRITRAVMCLYPNYFRK